MATTILDSYAAVHFPVKLADRERGSQLSLDCYFSSKLEVALLSNNKGLKIA